MRSLRAFLVRCLGLFDRGRRDRDFASELESHLQLQIDDAVRAGLTPGEARLAALRRIGGLERVKESHRDRRGFPLVESIGRDIGYSLRLLRKNPGFASAAIVPVALGIAATTTLFGVVNGVLLRPLPYADASRLVNAIQRDVNDPISPSDGGVLSRGTFEAWKSTGSTVDGLIGYDTPLRTLHAGGEPVRLQIVNASANLFDVLGAKPYRGRFFEPGEDLNEGAGVVVLSYDLWRATFGGDEQILGRVLRLDDRPYAVIGVAAPGFYFPFRGGLWVPKVGSSVVARLRSGSTIEQAEAEATAMAVHAREAERAAELAKGDGHVEPRQPPRVKLFSMLDSATAPVRRALVVMMAGALVVLLVASANAANLLLVRATRRGREIAVRAALGGSAARIARELFIDSAVIGACAGVLGLALALVGHRVLQSLLPLDFPRLRDIAMDWRVLGFGFAVSLLAMLVAGLAPAWKASRLDLSRAIARASGTGTASGARGWRFSSALLIGQIALSCGLLVGAGLLTRSFLALTKVDNGYDPANAMTVQVAFPASMPQTRRRDITTALLQRVRASPGVQAVGATNALPLEDVFVVFSLAASATSSPMVQFQYRVVSPGYFEAAGMQVVRGRAFDGTESPDGQVGVVVNEAFIRRYALDDPSKALQLLADSQGRRWQILGVVNDTRERGPAAPAPPILYRSYVQTTQPTFFNRVDLVVRMPDNPLAFMPALRGIVRDLDPQVALYRPTTMEEELAQELARPRLYSVTLVAFAAFVVAIVGTGLFGMLAYVVAQRRREIALRLALGAAVHDVLVIVMGRVALWTVVGVAMGVGLSVLVSRLLAGLLFGVVPLDPLTFAAAPCVVAATALIAACAPLCRALGVAPAEALKD